MVSAGWLAFAATLLALLGCASLAIRAWRNGRDLESDSGKLCATIDRAISGDFDGDVLTLETPVFRDVGQAVQRLMPSIRSTIRGLEWDAQHDPLTGLINAATFKRRCQQLLLETSRDGQSGALLFLDINEFKLINDGLGHHAGDKLLGTIADRMRLAVSTFVSGKLAAFGDGQNNSGLDPVIARLGGDEFAMFLPGNFSKRDIERFIQRLRRLAGEPCQIGPHLVRARLSIGIAFARDHQHIYEQLLAAADTAMYSAKSKGEESHCFFEEGMRSEADRILEREIELRDALRSGQFCLYFQPQLNLETGAIESAEALIRWNHPTRGVVMPSEFIPFAETYDLIDEIGDWVTHEAISTAARWWKDGREIRISINVSPKQLNRIELIAMIRACLNRHDLPPHALEIEVTEAAIMRSDEVGLERIKGLRADGVRIALDDFGTGYSNISQLLLLPMDRLKLDRSLVTARHHDKRSRLVTRAIIDLSRKMGFEVVAEGVEDMSDLNFLEKSKCTYAQGYLIAPPLMEAEFLKLAGRSRWPSPSVSAA
nr:GGDEF domain-containing phosphodiesterase [uncultured Sphingomonas sp.]